MHQKSPHHRLYQKSPHRRKVSTESLDTLGKSLHCRKAFTLTAVNKNKQKFAKKVFLSQKNNFFDLLKVCRITIKFFDLLKACRITIKFF